MKNKVNFQILVIILLTIILGTMCFYYFTSDDKEYFDYSLVENNQIQIFNNNENISSNNKSKTVSTTSEISSGLTEKKELHTTYYLDENYAEESKEYNEGEKLIKYTNGEYLTAPYKCVVTKINIPEISSKCTSNNYIQIESTKNLKLEIKVSEDSINKINIGDEAQIEISALAKTIIGNVTKISNTAQNGKFTVTVEFENDGEIKLGMTAKVVI